jgi:hypothetical protein
MVKFVGLYPKLAHATLASFSSNPLLHTVFHTLLSQILNLPEDPTPSTKLRVPDCADEQYSPPTLPPPPPSGQVKSIPEQQSPKKWQVMSQ